MPEHSRRMARRITALLQWRRRNAELAEEIATHADMKRAEFERAGLTPENARVAARRAMGNATSMREQARGVWLFTWSESVWQDVAYGLRSLRRQPAFTAAALLGLGCGLGFNAALFASFNALALRGYSVREPSRMTALFGSARDNRLNRQSLGFSLDEVRYLSQRAQSLNGIILTERSSLPVNGDDPVFMPVSANYFQVLGVGMERGRGFTPDDDRAAVPQQVMVVSHDFWQRRLGGDAGAQEPFSLNGMNYRMSGSVAPRFALLSEVSPEYFAVTDRRIIAGRALSVQDAGSDAIVVNESFSQKFGGVGEALGKPVFSGTTTLTIVGVVANAQDSDIENSRVPDVVYGLPTWNSPPHIIVRGEPGAARRLAAAITARDPSLFVRVRSFDWYVNDRLSGRLTAAAIAGLLGILALVLATVGMFGVFSYWVQQRTRDIGIRMALGATRGSVIRLVLGVSSRAVMWGLIVGVAGAVAGARLLQHSLNGLSPLDLPTFAGAIAVLVSAGLLATAVPAWRAVHVDPIRSLRVE